MIVPQNDVVILLGDVGANYYGGKRDQRLKEIFAELAPTFLCIHGNHEERPYMIDGYEEKLWNEGIVYWEEEYPNILFAKDGEIYDFDGKKCIAIGGAYSIDKYYRLMHFAPWFETEQPSEEIKAYVESQLEKVNWTVDVVFTHTVPKQYEPTWAFIPGYDQSRVDKSTEEWLDTIEQNLSYERWYAGHYHVESQEGPIRIMFNDYEEL